MILVTGGAGYIGSHVVKGLLDEGFDVVVLDNLTTGHQEAVDRRAKFIVGDLRNHEDVEGVLEKFPIQAVMHFAANCYVGESVVKPAKYYDNNVRSIITLLNIMQKNALNKIIFSSSCAVYGVPELQKISEKNAVNPISPYGRTKLIGEEMIKDYAHAYGFEYVLLRYFNVAGADPNGLLGEDHFPETHILPNILHHLSGRTEQITVYGNDYDTEDGTCIRDYIHVCDLAMGHILSLKHLIKGNLKNRTYNLGNGNGYSVRQLIKTCEKLTGKQAKVIEKPRRQGDPPKLIASSEKISKELGWKPEYSLEDMVRTAWEWFRKNPDGYKRRGE